MSGVTESDELRQALVAFIRDGVGDFDNLALRLFQHQWAHNPDYRAMVGERTVVRSAADIPPVPVALWRDLDLVSFPLDEATLVFRTSGTTGRRGEVLRRDTELYDLGARRFAEQVVGPIPSVGVSLVPDAADSSLGHMCRTFSPHLVPRFTSAGGVDGPGAVADLLAFSARGEPVFVPGTALALAQLVTLLESSIPLAEGSVVMVTGGFKGQVAAVSAGELRQALVDRFPGAKVVEEYGMTELSSQMWAEGPGLPLRIPPWMRVLVVDPWTGAPAERGLLRFIDLANFDTVLAIETRDEGELLPDGRLRLYGRLPGAPARGCSLTVEEAMGLQETVVPPPKETALARTVGPVHPADRERVRRMQAALADLPPVEERWGQGLVRSAVRAELAQAVAALGTEALLDELSTVPAAGRPASVAIVEAEGVFTAALEWVVLALCAGMTVRWKAPARWPDFAVAVGETLQQHGFPVTVDTRRSVDSAEVVVVFGSDGTIESVRRTNPEARVVGYGHRYGLAVVAGEPTDVRVAAVLRDHLRFDTRGCMAPAGLVVVDGPTNRWMDALAHGIEAAARRQERGAVASALGPEWRRRLGLARATLGAREVAGGAVLGVQVEHFVPVALPWMVSVVPVPDVQRLVALLQAHAAHVSVLARPDDFGPLLDPLVDRSCRLGEMQSPPFPRLHDGQPMLGRMCGWDG
jgi:hypothetical protein